MVSVTKLFDRLGVSLNVSNNPSSESLALAGSEDCVIQKNCAVKKSSDDELLFNLSWKKLL